MQLRIAFSLSLWAAAAATADSMQVYRCTVNGVATYGDKPCADAPSTVVTVRAPALGLTDAEIAQRWRRIASDQAEVDALLAQQRRNLEAERQRIIEHRQAMEKARRRAAREARLDRILSELQRLGHRPRRPAAGHGHRYP
jgi:hypothetical protein